MPRKPLFDEKGDALQTMLREEYGLDPKQAEAYAQQIVNGKASDSGSLRGEALQRIADANQARLKRISYYADVAKRYYGGEPVNKEDLDYLNAVHAKQHEMMAKSAQDDIDAGPAVAAKDEAIAGIRGVAGPRGDRYAVPTIPGPDTMDPMVRESARMGNMTAAARDAVGNPRNTADLYDFDGFNYDNTAPQPPGSAEVWALPPTGQQPSAGVYGDSGKQISDTERQSLLRAAALLSRR